MSQVEGAAEKQTSFEKPSDERRKALETLTRVVVGRCLADPDNYSTPILFEDAIRIIEEEGEVLSTGDAGYVAYSMGGLVEHLGIPEMMETGSVHYMLEHVKKVEYEVIDDSMGGKRMILPEGHGPVTMYDGRPAIFLDPNSVYGHHFLGTDITPLSDEALKDHIDAHKQWLAEKGGDGYVTALEDLLSVGHGEVTTEFRGTKSHHYINYLDSKRVDSVTYTILEDIRFKEEYYHKSVSIEKIKEKFEVAYEEITGYPITRSTSAEDVGRERQIRERAMKATLRRISSEYHEIYAEDLDRY